MCWFAITGAVHMFIEGEQSKSRCSAVFPCTVSKYCLLAQDPSC